MISSDEPTPWRGRHLDLLEADQLLQRAPARVFAVVGPHGVGKTCLLASFFLQLASGQRSDFPFRFASSRTLYGFRDLVERANRWTGAEGEEIVGHTPREQTERPGQFLHLGVRPSDSQDDRHIDILLSDLAGEWFSEWAAHANEGTRSRLGFLQRSDGFIVVADAPALLGPQGAKLDAGLGRMLRRLLGDLKPRRAPRALAIVFSKFDRAPGQMIPPAKEARTDRSAWGPLAQRASRLWTAVDQARERGFQLDVFAVSAFPRPLSEGQPVGVMAPFGFLMGVADRRDRWAVLPPSVPEDARGFATLRRWDLTR